MIVRSIITIPVLCLQVSVLLQYAEAFCQQGVCQAQMAFLRVVQTPKLFALDTPETDPSARHSNILPAHNPAANKILTCATTKQLMDAIDAFVKPGHKVAELGAQLRDVSTSICNAVIGDDDTTASSGHVTLVDITRKFPKNMKDGTRTAAMRQPGADTDFFPEVSTFSDIQHLDLWRDALFPSSSHSEATYSDAQQASEFTPYDVLVLDVNAIVGNDLEWTTLSIVKEFQALNRNDTPLIVLAKSTSLNQWASRLEHGIKFVEQKGEVLGIAPPHVIATCGVQEYRNTIPFTIRPGDSVLEVGCHFGTSTALLNEAILGGGGDDRSGYCIGVDVGSKIIAEAQRKYPSIFFRVGNAWKTADLLRIQQEYFLEATADVGITQHSRKVGFDVVYVDVGGLSGSDGMIEAISLISSIRYALEPRIIVIKSLCMQRLSSTLVPSWKLLKEQQQLVNK